ncbi:MAG TPA: hypothetical protein VM681_07825 [Candidatus Thermoplasmatota archaeon]|nr:hypothetical protein [Candidatus Thermoplasmatota archaeon]
MRKWGKRIDGFDEAPFPIRAFRDFYVTPVGGFSRELAPGEIGIREEALSQNTDLTPYEDLVTVSKVDGAHRIPLLLRALFCVVPLTARTPDALRKSPRGEAVMGPIDETSDPQRQALAIEEGDRIVLNSVQSSFGATRSRLWGGVTP